MKLTSILPVSLLLAAAVAVATPSQASAQALPTPRDFVSGLDLECYKTPGPALNLNLNLSHLNPVLINLGLPAHPVVVRELEETCVPVRKNNGGPSATALPFVRMVDLACYRVDAAPLPAPVNLNLTHLNPVLAGLPQHDVYLTKPAQLCVPVAKNNNLPPAAVAALVRYLDLECYDTQLAAHPNFSVMLHQLNPLLGGIPGHKMDLVPNPRKMCVPVRKNNQAIPAASLNILRWVDLEKFSAAANVVIAPVNLMLRHMNPLLANQPQVPVVLQEANSLMVPVAKNGVLPPLD
ncbi:MAG: hypothetical protein R3B48_19940 [Kofleriaceae bacterium]